ncbi:MAG TPA: hypothetical protein VLA13_05350 [Massilibacterium sp.]|nr:hypothetical protein [Massilibacterium sp.]
MKRTVTIYTCDICGRSSEWDKNWSRYSSILMDEVCPDLVPHVCSDRCRDELDAKIESGEIKLPVLRKPHGAIHSRVVEDKVGH